VMAERLIVVRVASVMGWVLILYDEARK